MSEAERLAEAVLPDEIEIFRAIRWAGRTNVAKMHAVMEALAPAATLLRAQSARIAALEDALRPIEEGTIERPILWTYREDGKPSKHDRCIHDVWMYETCAGCIDAHIAKALGKGSE